MMKTVKVAVMICLRFAVAAADPGGAATADNDDDADDDDNGDDDDYGDQKLTLYLEKLTLLFGGFGVILA